MCGVVVHVEGQLGNVLASDMKVAVCDRQNLITISWWPGADGLGGVSDLLDVIIDSYARESDYHRG